MWFKHDGEGPRHHNHLQIGGTDHVDVTTDYVDVTTAYCDDSSAHDDLSFGARFDGRIASDDHLGAITIDPGGAEHTDPPSKPRTSSSPVLPAKSATGHVGGRRTTEYRLVG